MDSKKKKIIPDRALTFLCVWVVLFVFWGFFCSGSIYIYLYDFKDEMHHLLYSVSAQLRDLCCII